MFRFCALYDHYTYFDRAIGVIYAAHRSNGLGYLHGRKGGDFADFVKTFGERPWLDAAPIPGLNLGQNMLYHEYILVQRAIGSEKFPAIDMDGYLQELEFSLVWIDDLDMRAAMREILEQHGLPKENKATIPISPTMTSLEPPKVREPLRKRLTPRRVAASLAFRIRYRWRLRERQDVVLFLADRFGIKPVHISGFAFRSDEEALRYALTYPRQPDIESPYLPD